MKATYALLGGLLALAACHRADPAPAKVVAGFTLPATSEATVAATFQNTSQNATSYNWSFGDGSASTTAAPTHSYAKAGTYTVTLRAYGANQDSAVASQPLTVGAYDVFAHATAKILGDYNFTLIEIISRPYTGYTVSGQGLLTVTRTGTSTINVVTPQFTYPATYNPDPTHPTYYTFEYHDFLDSGLVTFYPTGDSMHFKLTDHISASSNNTYDYRGFRRP